MAEQRDPKIDQSTVRLRGLGYKSFVAWRYLLVANRKVKPTTTRVLSTSLVLLVAAALLRATGLAPSVQGLAAQGLGDPLWILEIVALLVIGVVVFWRVLPYSRPALYIGVAGAVVLVVSVSGLLLLGMSKLPFVQLEPEQVIAVKAVVSIAASVGGGLVGLAMFFGCIRAYFTFFTTVPIGGVWIGTAALVMVLAVMSGFESDLREKILGSNAHLQITREDGEFTEWREVKARIDNMPGVVASTPFAVSEVVVAANNTGMNVIIKGIDPKTVGKVTDLVSDLEDREAMKRLDPITGDAPDLRVPQHPRTTTGPVIDPPPEDMPSPGDPIDFSGTGFGSGSAAGSGSAGSRSADSDAERAGAGAGMPLDAGNARAGAGASHGAGSTSAGVVAGRAGAGSGGDGAGAQLEGAQPFGGDAQRLLEAEKEFANDPPELSAGHPATGPVTRPATEPVTDRKGSRAGQEPRAASTPANPQEGVDPPPPDLLTTDEPPADYSRPDYLEDVVVKAIDSPFDTPSLSRRTQSLPGILVGRELVKQTHLYTGEEVRVVSPLSDPSNPDATGTPIPFNRDYRVAGIFYTGMYEYDLKYVYVTLDSLQEFLDRGDAIDGIEIRVNNPDDTDAFVSKFQETFGQNYRVQDWKELNRSLFSALKLEKIAMFLVLGIVILVASFSIVGNLIMVVVEKAREIALLKTLGASDVGVMQLFAIQGLMIGLIGTVLGIGTGLIGCWAGKRYGIPVSPDVYYIDRLPIHVDPLSVVAAASAGVLISIAATLYPAVVAARVRPAAGMRH
ncbi:MAG TPA: FtsX-like permease family protein [Kofleriaceae bacterium]|nr:FtsX-like permease family protein [Kofleriaceae bacterium]